MTDVKTKDVKVTEKVNPYAVFMTESDLELQGTDLDYGAFKVRVARAGGRNTMYSKVFAQVAKPYKNVNLRDLPKEDLDAIYAEVYARAVIKGWFVKNSKGEWVSGIVDLDGQTVAATAKTIASVLGKLPDLLSDIMDQASDIATFQRLEEEDLLGNS